MFVGIEALRANLPFVTEAEEYDPRFPRSLRTTDGIWITVYAARGSPCVEEEFGFQPTVTISFELARSDRPGRKERPTSCACAAAISLAGRQGSVLAPVRFAVSDFPVSMEMEVIRIEAGRDQTDGTQCWSVVRIRIAYII